MERDTLKRKEILLLQKNNDILCMLKDLLDVSYKMDCPDYLIETYSNIYANAFNVINEIESITPEEFISDFADLKGISFKEACDLLDKFRIELKSKNK